MNRRTSLKALFTIALALQFPSQASACRIGWDQHLFEEPPAPDVLPGAQIIRTTRSGHASLRTSSSTDRLPRLGEDQ